VYQYGARTCPNPHLAKPEGYLIAQTFCKIIAKKFFSVNLFDYIYTVIKNKSL